MKEQTYIVMFMNKDEIPVNFERWAYKKLETCIDRTICLCCRAFSLYKYDLIKTTKVVAYKTNGRIERKVWEITIGEFMNRLRSHKEWRTYDDPEWVRVMGTVAGQG